MIYARKLLGQNNVRLFNVPDSLNGEWLLSYNYGSHTAIVPVGNTFEDVLKWGEPTVEQLEDSSVPENVGFKQPNTTLLDVVIPDTKTVIKVHSVLVCENELQPNVVAAIRARL